jgi:hypothetical protein
MMSARSALVALLAALASSVALAEENPASPTAWGACPERQTGRKTGQYLLGRYANGVAVLEVESSGRAALAKLWAHATPGGTAIDWPGGRPGVRHLTDPKLIAEATPAGQAGRVYLWTSNNGWNGGEVANVTGVELAKSLCDAQDLVVYVVVKVDQAGSGSAVGSLLPPPAAADSPPTVPADTPRAVMDRLYSTALGQLQSLRAQKLTPASLAINLFPGHFSQDTMQYAVSVRWGNAFDDRFSVLFLADANGNLSRTVDRQEGGAGGTLVEAADLDGDGYLELFYQVTTLDGSSAALWSLHGGKLRTLVQTTPVGE